jgi:hypothetical protein
MQLANDISDYYKKHFSKVSGDKQFHFATRLGAWNSDSFCLEALEARGDIARGGDLAAIKQDLKELIDNPPNAKINAASTREQYFATYPELRGRMLALFRVRHLLAHYSVDARATLLEVCPFDELATLSDTLVKDDEALKVLSTYAINYIYLLHFVLFPDRPEPAGIAEKIYSLGDSYDLSSPEQIQLLIYLYTHCIIGEANFYARPVERDRDIYTAMLEKLNRIIEQNFDMINLDNKLEFLVCTRIMSFETPLFGRIYKECEGSISRDGTFVVDTLNLFRQSNKTSLSDSEHRNVLLIMSATRYPHAL